MASSKGYGPERGAGMGRGTFSVPKNPAPVPMKGSALNMSSPVQGQDAMKAKEMAKKQMKNENNRGMPA